MIVIIGELEDDDVVYIVNMEQKLIDCGVSKQYRTKNGELDKRKTRKIIDLWYDAYGEDELMKQLKDILGYKKDLVSYKKVIQREDIVWFYQRSSRCDNGKINNIRERVIVSIINGEIPLMYYCDVRWRKLYYEIMKFVDNVCGDDEVVAVLRGGRGYNYDFEIRTNCKIVKVEFKYNAKKISQLPQILQVNKICDFIDSPIQFIDFYYGYLKKFLTNKNLIVPDYDEWSKDVFHLKPACMSHIREKCDNDPDFRNGLKYISAECIKNWIKQSTFNIEKLNNKLQNQDGKVYMLYKDGILYKECLEHADLNVCDVEYEKNRFICQTKNKKILCLLRWKNRIGIGNPALQMSVVNRKDGE